MPTHYCIGNPCWICYPQLAPKQDPWPQIIQYRLTPDDDISGLLEQMLVDVFEQGLDEDTHYRAMPEDLDLEKIKLERTKLSDTSFKAKLLDLMIKDFEEKDNH